MRPLLAALALSLAALAQAQTGPYYPTSNQGYQGTNASDEELNVIRRQAIEFPSNVDFNKASYGVCMVAPAADWALDAKTEAVELKYLELLDSVLWRYEPPGVQGSGGKGRGGVISACGGRHSPGASFSLQKVSDDFVANCLKTDTKASVGGKYATVYPRRQHANPVAVIWETLELLIRSEHEAVALEAMDLANRFQHSAAKLAKPISEIARDPKASEARRLKAVDILTDIRSGEETAHVLGHVWQDESASKKLRIAALNNLGLILSTGDMRLNAPASAKEWPTCGPDNRMCEKLRRYMTPLHNLRNAERDERLKLSPLGEAAQCAYMKYPEAWRKKLEGR